MMTKFNQYPFMFCLALISQGTFANNVEPDDQLVVNRSHILYVPKTPHIRAFIEPGSILKKVEVDYLDRYKGRSRVITQGGIMGEMKSRDLTLYDDISKPLAYLRRPLKLGELSFSPRDVFKLEIVENPRTYEDEYKIIYPSPYYSFRDNAYYVAHDNQVYTEKIFNYHFNLIQNLEQKPRFPFWPERSTESIQWGCEDSEENKTRIHLGAEGKISTGFSLFKIFNTEASATANTDKESIRTKLLKDESFYHKVSRWVLYASYDNRTPILEIALEKTWPCNNNGSHEYNYTLHFQEEMDINPIVINRVWSHKKGMSDGGASPVGLHTLEDYRKFEEALKDFKFHHYIQGYDMSYILKHFLMRFTVNLSTP